MIQARSPLRYPGGKSRAVKQILSRIPQQFTEYREPFVGGGSVFLAIHDLCFQDMFLHPKCFVLNDLNYDLVCFWRMARDQINDLVSIIEELKTEYQKRGRELYNLLKSDEHYLSSDFNRAVRFFIMNRITFSGVTDAGGYSEQAFERRFTPSSIDRLREVSAYLQGADIACEDYTYWLEKSGTDVFIYLDPPYYSTTPSRLYGKRGELHTSFDHERFADAMKSCSHSWLITYDDSEYIRDLFSFAKIESWKLQYGMNNFKQESAEIGKEIFIWNY